MPQTMAKPQHRFWKIVHSPITRIILAFVFIGLVSTLVSLGLNALIQILGLARAVPQAVVAVIDVTVVCLAYALFVRLIERRTASELSTSKLYELVIGTAFGLLLFSVVIGALWHCSGA